MQLTESIFQYIPGRNWVFIFNRGFFLWIIWAIKKKIRETSRLSVTRDYLRRDTCLIMTRKRYPWEKGWQFADLSARLPRICLEPALSPHVGHATRHTQVTAPTVKLIFLRETGEGMPVCERYRYAISMTESLAGIHGPILILLRSDRGKKSKASSEIFRVAKYHLMTFLDIFRHTFRSARLEEAVFYRFRFLSLSSFIRVAIRLLLFLVLFFFPFVRVKKGRSATFRVLPPSLLQGR